MTEPLNPEQRAVKTNLQAKRVRMVFVADEIPPELRRIVEFLNAQMDPAEVLAVAIRQYTGDGLRTLVPQVLGQTAEAQIRKGPRPKRKWDGGSPGTGALGPAPSAVGFAVLRFTCPGVTDERASAAGSGSSVLTLRTLYRTLAS